MIEPAPLHQDSVSACAFAGREQLATGSIEGGIVVWDWRAGRAERTIPAHRGPIWSLIWDAHRQTLISAGHDGRVLLHGLDGEPRGAIDAHAGPAMALALSADGERLASGGFDGSIRLWRAADGKADGALAGHAAAVGDLDFSADGALVSGGRDDVVRIWDLRSGQVAAQGLGHTRWVTRVRAARQGVVSASEDGTLRLWDWHSGAERWRYTTDWERPIWGLGVAEGSAVVGAGGLVLHCPFDASAPGPAREVSTATARAIAVAGELVALGVSDGVLVMRGSDTLARLHTRARPSLSIAASPMPDRRGLNVFLGLPDGRVMLDDGRTRRELGPERGQFIFVTTAIGDDLVATGGFDGHVRLWRAGDGELLHTMKHGAYVFSISASEGRLLASGGGVISLWDIASGRQLAIREVPELGFHNWAALSADRIVAAGDGDVLLRLRLLGDDQVVEESRTPLDTRLITGLRLPGAPDQALIATANGDVRRLDLATGRTQVLHAANGSFVRNFELSPDGRHVLSSSEHAVAAVYDLDTGRTVTPEALARTPAPAATFASTGEIVFVDGTGEVHVLAPPA
ncbi:MAG TPA: WD40 repeat domain-containing protein [Caulobacteraceae bacterium]|jgi:WD40 repeat protein